MSKVYIMIKMSVFNLSSFSLPGLVLTVSGRRVRFRGSGSAAVCRREALQGVQCTDVACFSLPGIGR